VTARGKSAIETRLGRKAWRAGLSNANVTAFTNTAA
jgi:hypothetical protein